MSVCAVKVYKDRIEMSADSIVTQGYNKQSNCTKMYKVNSLTFASSGYVSELEFFRIFCKTRKPTSADIEGIIDFFAEFSEWKAKKTSNKDCELNNSYLLIFEKKAFRFYDWDCLEVETFEAIGAGYVQARTALYLDKNPEDACKVACKLAVNCSEPVKTFTIKK